MKPPPTMTILTSAAVNHEKGTKNAPKKKKKKKGETRNRTKLDIGKDLKKPTGPAF
jgi:hypothetical protein